MASAFDPEAARTMPQQTWTTASSPSDCASDEASWAPAGFPMLCCASAFIDCEAGSFAAERVERTSRACPSAICARYLSCWAVLRF